MKVDEVVEDDEEVREDDEEVREEDGRNVIFKFKFFDFSFFGFDPSTNFIFGFGPSTCVTYNPVCHISIVCHVSHCHNIPRQPHVPFCNRS